MTKKEKIISILAAATFLVTADAVVGFAPSEQRVGRASGPFMIDSGSSGSDPFASSSSCDPAASYRAAERIH
ncbi:MAG: hypothetical protein V4531_08925 [Actinomycetota bacterium]